jgi:hypothetical protein
VRNGKQPLRRKLSISCGWMLVPVSYLSLYDIMINSHFDTWHHNKISKARDSKSVNLTHFRRLSICNLFSRNISHSHDNLRRVSKSPLLHPFTCRRSGTLDWRVTKATSADSSRLIHTILAHSSIAHSLIAVSSSTAASSTPLYLSIFHRHRTPVPSLCSKCYKAVVKQSYNQF